MEDTGMDQSTDDANPYRSPGDTEPEPLPDREYSRSNNKLIGGVMAIGVGVGLDATTFMPPRPVLPIVAELLCYLLGVYLFVSAIRLRKR